MRARTDPVRRSYATRVVSRVLLLATALLVGLCTASSASAANLAPNPGFENACGTPTKACSWHEEASSIAEVQRDPSIAHTGTASYRVHLVASFFGAGGTSDCMAPPPVGSASMSLWYRTTDARVVRVEMLAWSWDSATCNSSASGSSLGTSSPITDGNWHQLSSSGSVFSAQGFNFEVGFTCQSACAGAQVHFDDVVFDQTPTAVRVTSMQGRATRAGALLRWRSAQETSVLGFNVFRHKKGRFVKLNRTLIPSVFGGTATGYRYSWLDREAPRQARALRYRLQAVSLDGKRSWVGTTTLTR